MSKKNDESVTYCGGNRIPGFDISENDNIEEKQNHNNVNIDNIISFPSKKLSLEGTHLKEECVIKESDDEEESDEVAEFVLNQLFTNAGKEYNYKNLLLGLNKAYLQVLLQMVDDSGFDPDEFLDHFYEEADRLARIYFIKNKNENFDPVKASGSLALASSYIFEAIDDDSVDET